MFHDRLATTAMIQALGDTTTHERVTVMQGQALVSADPRIEFSPVLGSCVALCLFDPVAGLGGINHFLLAEPPRFESDPRGPTHFGFMTIDEHFGTYLMELLVNHMLAHGARRDRLKARLYGGAHVNRTTMPIGSANADFALGFVHREGIALLRSDLCGTRARRVDFRPASGQVRCRQVEDQFAPPDLPTVRPARASGDVELF